MVIHLSDTTISKPEMPLSMVAMDAKQDVQLIRLINPRLAIAIHFEYRMFAYSILA